MLTPPSTSICSAARAAVALIPGLLRRLPVQGLRIANSSEELLDFFEEQYGVPRERTGRHAIFLAVRTNRRLPVPNQ
jgi:hypothetical protein